MMNLMLRKLRSYAAFSHTWSDGSKIQDHISNFEIASAGVLGNMLQHGILTLGAIRTFKKGVSLHPWTSANCPKG